MMVLLRCSKVIFPLWLSATPLSAFSQHTGNDLYDGNEDHNHDNDDHDGGGDDHDDDSVFAFV